MLWNLYATPGLLEDVRREIARFACLTKDHHLQIDWKGLLNRCPLFKACYFESLRLDSAPWSFKRLQKMLHRGRSRRGCSSGKRGKKSSNKPTTFHLERGDAVLVPSDLHHSDPRYFVNPSVFQPERFFVEDGGAVRSEIKSIRSYGGGATMCKGTVSGRTRSPGLRGGHVDLLEFGAGRGKLVGDGQEGEDEWSL